MKRSLKISIILLLVLLSIFAIYKLVTYKEQPFRQFELKENHNLIFNQTDSKYLDTIIQVGISELAIDSLTIVIKPMDDVSSKQFQNDNMSLKAHIRGSGRQYRIWTESLSRSEAIKVFAHELIHLQQYYTNRLVVKDRNIYWKTEVISAEQLKNINYNERPWEIEAFEMETGLQNKIQKIVY